MPSLNRQDTRNFGRVRNLSIRGGCRAVTKSANLAAWHWSPPPQHSQWRSCPRHQHHQKVAHVNIVAELFCITAFIEKPDLTSCVFFSPSQTCLNTIDAASDFNS